MTERFKKAYDALVNAYFEGTLAKGSCLACACGNIIAAAAGIEFTEDDIFSRGENSLELYGEVSRLWAEFRTLHNNIFVAKEGFENQMNAAGYTVEEFAKIENAFECTSKISFHEYTINSEQKILEDQYNGLCAVVDVLLALDEDKSSGEEYKAKFRQHPKLQTA